MAATLIGQIGLHAALHAVEVQPRERDHVQILHRIMVEMIAVV